MNSVSRNTPTRVVAARRYSRKGRRQSLLSFLRCRRPPILFHQFQRVFQGPLWACAVGGRAGKQRPQPVQFYSGCKSHLFITSKTGAGSYDFVRSAASPPERDASRCPGNRLLFGFDDVPPYYFNCLVTLGCKVRPGFRLVECHSVIQAVPFDDGRTLGRRPTLYLNNPSSCGA
jgi:hypothetical protein